MAEQKTVYVVMGNDYPDAVFDDETAAEAYVVKRKAQRLDPHRNAPRIHWRVYPFILNKGGASDRK